MERRLWWPNLVPGSLAVTRGPGGLRGSLTFDTMWSVSPVPVRFLPSSEDEHRFEVLVSSEPIAVVTGTVREGVFSGRIDWKSAEPQETNIINAERVPERRRFEPDGAAGPMPLAAEASAAGVDPAALQRLIHYASRFDTDSLLVAKDGRLVCDRTFLRPRAPFALGRLTEGIAALSIPLLVEDGKLGRDLDVPVSKWFPEWRDDPRKSRITLRHLLSHQSGLSQRIPPGSESDRVAAGRALASARDPGTACEQNDLAFDLVAGIVAAAAGEPIDTYLARRLFRPLGIEPFAWPRDRTGTPRASGDLELAPPDLIRIASMLGGGGRWNSEQVVPSWWIEEIGTPSGADEEAGLGWRLTRTAATETVVQTQARLDRLRERGCAEAAQLAPLVGKTFESRRAWWAAAIAILGEKGVAGLRKHLPHPQVGGELRGPVAALSLRDEKGQRIVLLPKEQMAIVRGRRGFAAGELPAETARHAVFPYFEELCVELVR